MATNLINGGTLFTAIFPVYVSVPPDPNGNGYPATSITAAGETEYTFENPNYPDLTQSSAPIWADQLMVSINGGSFNGPSSANGVGTYIVLKGPTPSNPLGINRIVFAFQNCSAFEATLMFRLVFGGFNSTYSNPSDKYAQFYHRPDILNPNVSWKDCIPAITSLDGLVSGVKGIFLYGEPDGVPDLGVKRYYTPKATSGGGCRDIVNNQPVYLTGTTFETFQTFNFWTNLRGPESDYPNPVERPVGSVEWPSIEISHPYDTITGKVGEPLSYTLPASDAVWQLINGKLPDGITLNSATGVISGTPTKSTFGSINNTPWNSIEGPDGSAGYFESGDTAAGVEFRIADGAPIITPGQVFNGKVGLLFKDGLTNAASAVPTTQEPFYRSVDSWAASSLPSNLTIDAATGEIEGFPQTAGTFTIPLTATGSGGQDTENIILEIEVGNPVIFPRSQSFAGKVGVPVSFSIQLLDPVNRPAFSWVAQSLPPGLSINYSTGLITGTPTTIGEYSYFIRPQGDNDSYSSSYEAYEFASGDYVTFTISQGPPSITPGQTGSGKVGEAFSKTFSLTDSANRPATSWSAAGLPSWASINSSTGEITGTPQDGGSTTITLTATGPGGTDTETATISIAAGAPIITSGQSFTGKVGDAFSGTISLTDAIDRPATSWSATGLPPGLSLNASTGVISGTPTTKGSFTASFTATGSGGTSAATSVSFTITDGVPIITPGQTGSGKVGDVFSKIFSLTDSANRPATSWSAAGLPSWASINSSTGAITGTPQDVETTTITLTATGPGGSDTETATISIAIGVPIIIAGQTFTGKVGDAFSANISLDDALDRPATAWAATGLPAGLSINSSTGAITGSPTTIGSFTASIAASNGAGSGASQSVGFTIEAGAPIVTSNQTLNGTVGTAFSAGIALTNSANRPATSYTFTGLPAWAATNSSSGIIAGTPTTAGTTTFSVTATGPGGTSEPTNVSLVISTSNGGGGGTTPTITMQLPSSQSFTATVGSAFSATPQVLSGEPVTWYATDLPDWASIDSATGQITGTPTFTGTHYISLTAVDENSLTATGVLVLTTVSWNTLELYVDPKGRKMLSKANTRSVLSKMTLKRDDRTPFTIVFVSDTTTFSVPSDYNISVGIKQTYGGEYLAYADADSGMLDLTTAPVQSLFADEPEQIDALLEIKWEDTESSAIRTITLPLQIQNSVIRGNLTGGGGPVIAPGFHVPQPPQAGNFSLAVIDGVAVWVETLPPPSSGSYVSAMIDGTPEWIATEEC